jgi:GntR family transcriptional regulator/MocR family aminotransferase
MSSLEQAGVQVYPVEMHAVRKGQHCHQIILGYGNLIDEQVVEGVKRIARAIRIS